MTTIHELPYEILVRHLLATLRLCDLAHMAAVCRFFRELCKDEYLWQIMFLQDFGFYPPPAMCRLGWRALYKAMMNVEVYTWGSNLDGRLGHGRKYRFNDSECLPKRLRKMQGLPLVQLVSTGWGFHALDKDGYVWTWGRLAYTSLRLFDNQPKMLTTPSNIASLAGGRAVMLAKGRQGEVWQWHWENKPVRIVLVASPPPPPHSQAAKSSSGHHHHHHRHHPHSHHHDNNSQHDHCIDDPVVKLTAGWDLCAVLTWSGRLFAWNHQPHAQLTQQSAALHLERIYLQHAIQLSDQGPLGASLASQGDKFVNVAAGLDFLVVVTGRGYVFKFMAQEPHGSSSWASQQQQQQQQQQQHHHQFLGQVYVHGLGLTDHSETLLGLELDHLQATPIAHQDGSEMMMMMDDPPILSPPSAYLTVVCPQAVRKEGVHLVIFTKALQQSITNHRQHEEAASFSAPPFLDARLQRLRKRQSQGHRVAEQRQVEHTPFQASAGYQKFAVFHQGVPIVLLGHRQAQSATSPTVLSRLLDQNRPCALALGDYHQALLTDDGLLRTWGGFAEGALGQGDLRQDVPVPTPVLGGGLCRRFVFRVALAGWQSGCLAIELPEEEEEEEKDEDVLNGGDVVGNDRLGDWRTRSESEGDRTREGENDNDDDETLVSCSSSWWWSSSPPSSLTTSSSSSSSSSGSTAILDKYSESGDVSSNGGKDRVQLPRLALTRLCPELRVFDPGLPQGDDS
ncbi:hypothetical protein DFQ26_006839 [Actinomortierella ambigua]|nr:hypothetical protein DFQ26_006839 [Actinomortierella ambigua]